MNKRPIRLEPIRPDRERLTPYAARVAASEIKQPAVLTVNERAHAYIAPAHTRTDPTGFMPGGLI